MREVDFALCSTVCLKQRLYLIDWVEKKDVWKHILMSKNIRIHSSKYSINSSFIFVSNNYMICDDEIFYKTIFSKIAIKIKHGKLHFHCLLFGEAWHTSDRTTKLRFFLFLLSLSVPDNRKTEAYGLLWTDTKTIYETTMNASICTFYSKCSKGDLIIKHKIMQ